MKKKKKRILYSFLRSNCSLCACVLSRTVHVWVCAFTAVNTQVLATDHPGLVLLHLGSIQAHWGGSLLFFCSQGYWGSERLGFVQDDTEESSLIAAWVRHFQFPGSGWRGSRRSSVWPMDSRSVAAAGARCVGAPRPYVPASHARLWLCRAQGGVSTVYCVREDHVPHVHATFMTLHCYSCCFVISVVDLVPSFAHRTLSEFLCSRPHSGRAGRPLAAWQVSP